MFSVEKKGLPEREEEILAFWEEKGVFLRSIEQRDSSPLFSFYDGPPFATGLPHYGHILAGTLKDVVPRYKTMKGFKVPRRFGWDCHGLPVEHEIEKAFELSGAPAIETFGIARFNEECRGIVQRYTEEWKATVQRMGRWVDFSRTYKTMDLSFMESVWWVFGQLWKKGLVYKGYKVMPVSAKLGTPVSNFEANLNYKEVDDPSLYFRVKIQGEEGYFIVWTTTPWTLPMNLGLIVHPEITYAKVRYQGEIYYVGKKRVEAIFKGEGERVGECPGSALIGKAYEPIFDFYAGHAKAFRVFGDPFVGEEDGSGVVHMAPAFGEVDYFVGKREGIEPVCPVDSNGMFTQEVPPLKGVWVKDADKVILGWLKQQGKTFRLETIRHRYPFCWRSDTPLIYKAVDTWFIAVEKIKDQLMANNEKIHWVPGHIQQGRFGKWLANARDWAVSRNRYWGTPIPIWESEDGERLVISSKAELESYSGQKLDDIHRHFVDDLIVQKDGKRFKRIPEVFDCWFESGSMPYAQNHYPFENKELFDQSYPADFIAEGLDQTRAWFYTLNVLSTALFDVPAFKNVIVNGILLAEDGNKMSKRLKNYPDPMEVVNEYGADSIRLYLLNSPAVEANDLRFAKRGVELVSRQVLIPMWNAYVFLATYAGIYDWKPGVFEAPEGAIDRWIVSRLMALISDVEGGMEAYELAKAVQPFVNFIDELTNWYIRRSRGRFWTEEDSQDRQEAFATLYFVLKRLCMITAPFIPFISDAIYRELRVDGDPESVHLCDFPHYDRARRDETLEKGMGAVKLAVSLGHGLRKQHKIKVRQPLSKALLVCADAEILSAFEEYGVLIKEELNVKELEISSDEGKFVQLQAKPNFPVLGKRLGRLMRSASCEIQKLSQAMIKKLEAGSQVEVMVEGERIVLEPGDVMVSRLVKEGSVSVSEGAVIVLLETMLSDELVIEGMAREIVNKINTMRRSHGMEVTDRIHVTIDSTEPVRHAFLQFQDYICHETLSLDIGFSACQGTQWDLNGEPAMIAIAKSE